MADLKGTVLVAILFHAVGRPSSIVIHMVEGTSVWASIFVRQRMTSLRDVSTASVVGCNVASDFCTNANKLEVVMSDLVT